MTPHFPGILPAVTTPFEASGAVDPDALGRNVAWLVSQGVHGIVGAGTVGESGSLTDDERRIVLETIVAAVDGRVPVVAGINAVGVPAATATAAMAQAAGAAGLMCMPPAGYRADDGELEAFFSAVAEASDLPLMLYNNALTTGVDISAGQVVALFEKIETLVAVKELSNDPRRIAELLNAADVEVLVGGDDYALEGLAAGATGWISGVANIAPAGCVRLYEALLAGDLPLAREIYGRLLPLARLDMKPKLVQYFKAGLDAIGQTGGPSRSPRLPLTAAEHAELVEALDALDPELQPA